MAKAVERHRDHIEEARAGQREEDEIDPPPWPIEMSHYLVDPHTHKTNFWPWPNKDWAFNRPALDAMTICLNMEYLLDKKEDWTPEENEFFLAIHEEEQNASNP